MAGLHVLLIPSFYPTPSAPITGSFFREQALALAGDGTRVGILYCSERAPWQTIGSGTAWPRGFHWEDDQDLKTLRAYRSRLWPGYGRARLQSWARFGVRAYHEYVSRCGPPDILHAHSADPGGLLAARIKRRFGIPFVLTEHASWLVEGQPRRGSAYAARTAIEEADAAIAVSPALAKRLDERYPAPPGGWLWIPNGVSQRFLEAPLSERERSPDGKFRFLNVAGMVGIKGQRDLLLAFARAFGRKGEVSLAFGGTGPMEDSLRSLARELGIEGKVEFLGALSRRQVVAELASCDAFVLPSHFETFGVVLIEALAMGRPVLATKCGGPESVVNNQVGSLVEPGDLDELSEALKLMRQAANRYCASELREYVRSSFGPEVIARRIVGVYQEVLNRGNPS